MRSSAERSQFLYRALIVSVAVHGAFFTSVFLFGTRLFIRVIPPIKTQSVAQLTFSGGSHAIRIELPIDQFAAHTREPAKNAPAAKKTDIPMQVPALKKSGGGSTRAPHHGDGSSTAVTGNGSDAQDIHPAFPIFSPTPPSRTAPSSPPPNRKS